MDIQTIPNFLTKDECEKFVQLIQTSSTNHQNFTDNGNFSNKKWIDNELCQTFFNRLPPSSLYLRPNNLVMTGMYEPGESFGMHTDTGLYYNLDEQTKTQWTLLIYLNDEFKGGETVFYDTITWKEYCRIKPETGKALIFDIDLWHSGETVLEGQKYWIGCEIIGKM